MLRSIACVCVLVAGVASCGGRTALEGLDLGDDDDDDDDDDAQVIPPGFGEAPYRGDDACAVVGDEGATVDVSFTFRDRPLDLVLLLDATSSMEPVQEALREALEGELGSGLLDRFEDLRIGVAYFADFPVGGYGAVPTPERPGDLPFVRLLPLTSDFTAAAEAVGEVPGLDGGDPPESIVEALYTTATGAGGGFFVAPIVCEGWPDERGAFCTTGEREAVVVLITDWMSHNGPGDTFPYDPALVPFAATWDETSEALVASALRVLPILARFRDTPAQPGELPLVRAQHERFARDTGAVDEGGVTLRREITFPLGRTQLIGEIVDAVAGVRLGRLEAVELMAVAVDGDEAALDAVRTLRALRADPAAGATVRGARFEGVRPGTELTARLEVGPLPPGRASLRLRVRFLRPGPIPLADRVVRLVAAEDADGC